MNSNVLLVYYQLKRYLEINIPVKALQYLLEHDDKAEVIFDYFKEQIALGKESIHFRGRLLLFIKNIKSNPSTNNLRPIVVTSILIKTLEKIIVNRVDDLLVKNIDPN